MLYIKFKDLYIKFQVARILNIIIGPKNKEIFFKTALQLIISRNLIIQFSWRQFNQFIAMRDSNILKVILGNVISCLLKFLFFLKTLKSL